MQQQCLYCHFIGAVVWVHGHGQCARCHTNIEPCCQGEPLLASESLSMARSSSLEDRGRKARS